MDAFRGASGTFDREAYRFALDRNNLTEADFEQGIREDIARSVLQGAVVGGVLDPKALTDTLTAYAGTNAVFPANQILTRRLGPIEVAPGRQEIRLANLTRAEPPATLLVQQISAADR